MNALLSPKIYSLLSELFVVMAIGGTILQVVALFFHFAFRRKSASFRFAILRVLFCGCLTLPLMVFCLPELPLGLRLNRQPSRLSQQNGLQSERQPQIPHNVSTVGKTASSIGDIESSLPLEIHSELREVEATAKRGSVATQLSRPAEKPTVSDRVQPSYAKETLRTVPGQTQTLASLLAVWGAVAILMLLRQLSMWYRIRKIVSNAIPIHPDEIASQAGLKISELGDVGFYLSNQFSSPVTTGIRRPIVVLADYSLKLDESVLSMVIRHELAHINRCDVLWQTVFSVVRAMYWFHPLVWYTNQLAKRERELACDDAVLASGAQPEIYASVLLDHAAAATGSTIQWGAAIPMVQVPLQFRINSILDEKTCRQMMSWRLTSLLITAMTLLVVIVGAVRPFMESSSLPNVATNPTQKVEQAAAENRLPKLLSGKIIDEQGQPLKGVKIDMQFVTWAEDKEVFVARRQNRKKWELVTDENGVYTLDTTGLDASMIRSDLGQINFLGEASIEGRVAQPIFQTGRYVLGKREFRPVSLPQGRLISGCVKSPADAVNTTVVNPRIRVSGPGRWMSRPVLCGKDGGFSLLVPKVGEIEVLAFADNFAATRVFVGKDELVGDIELNHGTRVSGQVLDATGRPVSGVVVFIRNDYFNDIAKLHLNGNLLPHSAVKTGMDGRFQFPPHRGPCTIAVVNESRSHDTDSNLVNLFANQKPPVVLPIAVDLDGSTETLSVTLRESETVSVSGTVRWPDGRGAVGLEVTGSVMAGGVGIVLNHSWTDSNGEYQLQLPVNASPSISCFGGRDKDSIWHYADPSNDLDASQKTLQLLGLKKLSSSVEGADWTLVKKIDRGRPAKASVKALASEHALHEIASRFYRTRVDDRDLEAAISEFFELEEMYRGERAAFNALRMTLRWTNGSSETRKNYQEAIRRLKEHYLDYPELDGVMSELSRQFDLEGSAKFLELVEKNSSHPQVIASSLLNQMRLLAYQIRSRDFLVQTEWKVEGLEKIPTSDQLEVTRLVANLKKLNPQDLENRIENISKRIKRNYSNLKAEKFVSNINSFNQRRYRPDDLETFGALADRIIFRVSRLRPGKTVEDFEGTSIDGEKFKLSDYRGQVVMLMFSANWCGPCKAMYPENRELVTNLKDRPFQLISVMGDHQADTVSGAIESGDITWLTTWDGERGPISTKWNITGWPTVFVIDHLGVIRSTESDARTRSSLIEKLIKKAEQK